MAVAPLHEPGLLPLASPAARAAIPVGREKAAGEKEQESEWSWRLHLSGRDWDRLLDHVSYPKSL